MTKDDILFGRKEFTVAYNHVLSSLSLLLETEDAIDFDNDCNIIYDTIASGQYDNGEEVEETLDFTDETLYPLFKKRIFVLLDKILLKYGIKSEINSIYLYKDIFNILVNLKLNEIDISEYNMILNGDFGLEDKLSMIFENYTDNSIELIESIEVSEMFFMFIEDIINKPRIKVNDEMVLRAMLLNVVSELEFKKTQHCINVLNGEENIMVELLSSMDTVNSIIRSNLVKYYNSDEKLVSPIDAIIEIIYTYIFYNKTNMVILSDIVNKDTISKNFKINFDNTEIKNILNRITNKIGGKL